MIKIKKKILIVGIIVTLMLMSMLSVVSAQSRRTGIAVCVPGYKIVGHECKYNSCYGISDKNNVFNTNETCYEHLCKQGYKLSNEENKCVFNNCNMYDDENIFDDASSCEQHYADILANKSAEMLYKGRVSTEQINELSGFIRLQIKNNNLTLTEAQDKLIKERKQIQANLSKMLSGKLKNDTKIISSFEVSKNLTINRSRVRIHYMYDTDYNRVEKMKEVYQEFVNKTKANYQDVDIVPLNNSNQLIIAKKKVKVLGLFDVEFEDKYIVNEYNSIVEQKRSIWSYFFRGKEDGND